MTLVSRVLRDGRDAWVYMNKALERMLAAGRGCAALRPERSARHLRDYRAESHRDHVDAKETGYAHPRQTATPRPPLPTRASWLCCTLALMLHRTQGPLGLLPEKCCLDRYCKWLDTRRFVNGNEPSLRIYVVQVLGNRV